MYHFLFLYVYLISIKKDNQLNTNIKTKRKIIISTI
nr:MAG TPA: hypothetical protein [Caudoviricetes sp.]